MTGKMKVRVVKKCQVVDQPVKSGSVKATRIAAREMVSTVSDWVSEFKLRKREETKSAIETFFSNQTQPSES
jgi:hypothetical protein